jgi:hypothetical protein
MTPNEWKERCAARYQEKAGLTDDQAKEFAEACFEAQEGPFSTAADYNPENCADEDMSYWASDAV